MRIIFQDIDGVLLPGKALETTTNSLLMKEFERHHDLRKIGEKLEFDNNCIKNLIHVVEATNAYLVVSSSWRKFFPETILDILEQNGLEKSLFHNDALCTYKLSSDKCHEIGFWMNDHKQDISDYIVLDDTPVFPVDSSRRSHVIQTDFGQGLSEREVSLILQRWN